MISSEAQNQVARQLRARGLIPGGSSSSRHAAAAAASSSAAAAAAVSSAFPHHDVAEEGQLFSEDEDDLFFSDEEQGGLLDQPQPQLKRGRYAEEPMQGGGHTKQQGGQGTKKTHRGPRKGQRKGPGPSGSYGGKPNRGRNQTQGGLMVAGNYQSQRVFKGLRHDPSPLQNYRNPNGRNRADCPGPRGPGEGGGRGGGDREILNRDRENRGVEGRRGGGGGRQFLPQNTGPQVYPAPQRQNRQGPPAQDAGRPVGHHRTGGGGRGRFPPRQPNESGAKDASGRS
uniref:Uncharacterized protein n=1 Tax=Chromera velia CCMP2878 TaxID=1169474 RepID=A0A0G4HGF5_9ALVE|eukprot:Cvel_1014.t1-p1 / transcript=Cvel_1014.t1 / gene=Cvel_1014 / organism=Chromera_velia_CCMP2878 / gene_product=hypothetical protein / transcript_product=hypothetical protein / location=Cvel_scaffold33:46024-47176(+) / protein_length=283 / sequence_SO=supercontig / SO=protein_coding / is_pseudo=false